MTENQGVRKRLISSTALGTAPQRSKDWIRLTQIAEVEVTSEDREYPIESAFNFGDGPGWRAGGSGKQTIRLLFDRPQRLKRIWLRFVETGAERTQEFTLRWSADKERAAHEVVRQQWNFSPSGSPTEIEDYEVDLSAVSVLELARLVRYLRLRRFHRASPFHPGAPGTRPWTEGPGEPRAEPRGVVPAL